VAKFKENLRKLLVPLNKLCSYFITPHQLSNQIRWLEQTISRCYTFIRWQDTLHPRFDLDRSLQIPRHFWLQVLSLPEQAAGCSRIYLCQRPSSKCKIYLFEPPLLYGGPVHLDAIHRFESGSSHQPPGKLCQCVGGWPPGMAQEEHRYVKSKDSSREKNKIILLIEQAVIFLNITECCFLCFGSELTYK
jgi:hypothetical protein